MISRNQIRNIRALQKKKNRLEECLFIVEGEKMVEELLRSNYQFTHIFASLYARSKIFL